MNNEDEMLVRQSKWSGRRVVLLYWFAIVFVGTAAAAGLGAGILSPKYTVTAYDHSGFPTPWHPEDCRPCHEAEYLGWNETLHARLLTPVNSTHVQHWNGDYYTMAEIVNDTTGCCHVTRYKNDTSVIPSGNGTVWDWGVTCAQCHNPGKLFYPGPAPLAPGNVMPSYPCGMLCHMPAGATVFDNAKAAHVNSMADLLASGYASSSCLHCMAGLGLARDLSGYNVSDPTLKSINCYTCHDPHATSNFDYKGNKANLRRDTPAELCGTCHTDTFELLTEAPAGKHSSLDCSDCHGYQFKPAGWGGMGGTTWQNASWVLNHSWALRIPDACGRCHASYDVNMTLDDVIAGVADRIAAMEAIQDNINASLDEFDINLTAVQALASQADAVAGVSDEYMANIYSLIEEAEDLADFVRDDPSGGFHNPQHAAQKLALAFAKLESATILAKTVIPVPPTTTTTAPPTTQPTTTTTTTAATGIALIFSIMGIVAFLLVKKRRRV